MKRSLRQSGYSLVEVMLALGVGLLVMVAVYAGYTTKRTDAEVEILDAAVDIAIYKASMAYASEPGYRLSNAGNRLITNENLSEDTGGLPEGFVSTTNTTQYGNFWGGQSTISAESSNGTVFDLLTLTFTNLPSRVCVDLVNRIAPRVYDTRVNNTLVGLTPARTREGLGRSSVKPGQMVPLCQQAANTIKFRHLKPFNFTVLRSQPIGDTMTPAEAAAITPNYNRIEAALTARETAQNAIP